MQGVSLKFNLKALALTLWRVSAGDWDWGRKLNFRSPFFFEISNDFYGNIRANPTRKAAYPFNSSIEQLTQQHLESHVKKLITRKGGKLYLCLHKSWVHFWCFFHNSACHKSWQSHWESEGLSSRVVSLAKPWSLNWIWNGWRFSHYSLFWRITFSIKVN